MTKAMDVVNVLRETVGGNDDAETLALAMERINKNKQSPFGATIVMNDAEGGYFPSAFGINTLSQVRLLRAALEHFIHEMLDPQITEMIVQERLRAVAEQSASATKPEAKQDAERA